MMHDAQTYLSPESYSAAFVSWYHFAAPRIAKRAARIVTVSEFSRQMLIRFGVVPADKITVLHNGVDHLLAVEPDAGLGQRLGLTQGGYVLAMASTQAHKNIQVLLKAFADPALADVPLVLYGAAENVGGDQPLPPNVVLAGRVSDAELRSLMEQAAVFAFPSTTEGFGLPPMEAMSLACPAVVAPGGAVPEVCGDAVLYADSNDPAAWVAAIRHLLDDPEARAAWSARGLERARMFPWAKSAKGLLAVIGDVAAGQPPAANQDRLEAAR
jgi:glycosyltransferase involved in cell wall biosynthesis